MLHGQRYILEKESEKEMKKVVFLFASAAMLLGACSSYKYYSNKSDHVDFSKYHSYAWVPSGELKANRVYDNTFAEEQIIDAASRELNERGLQLDNRRPDLLIRYSALVNDKTRTYSNPVYYRAPSYYIPRVTYYAGRPIYYYQYVNPFPVYVGSELRKETFEEANVMIDIIDRETSKVIWRGWGKGEVNNPEKAVKDIPKVIDNIFGKFPAK
jgi:hypothetical protein